MCTIPVPSSVLTKSPKQCTEGRAIRLHIRQQLLVFGIFQLGPFQFRYNFEVGDGFVAGFEVFGFEVGVMLREVSTEAVFGQNHHDGCSSVTVVGTYLEVGDVAAEGHSGVGR